MTLDQFIERLKKTPRRWYMTSEGELRLDLHEQGRFPFRCACPLTVLCNNDSSLWLEAAASLRIREDVANKIADAADATCLYRPNVRRLRERLVRACGLAMVCLWCAIQQQPAFPPVREPSNALQPMTDQPAYDSWRGNQLDPVFNDTITRDAYGRGVHADENGEPTFDTELFNHKW